MSLVVTDNQIAVFLSRNKKKRKDSPEGRFLEQFSARSLQEALKTKNKKIDLKWYVNELVGIVKDSELDSARLTALERLKELITLGAIQDEELINSLTSGTDEKKKRMKDPFTKSNKTLRMTGA